MDIPDAVRTLDRDLRAIVGDRLRSLVVYNAIAGDDRISTLAVVDGLSADDLRASVGRVAAWDDAGLGRRCWWPRTSSSDRSTRFRSSSEGSSRTTSSSPGRTRSRDSASTRRTFVTHARCRRAVSCCTCAKGSSRRAAAATRSPSCCCDRRRRSWRWYKASQGWKVRRRRRRGGGHRRTEGWRPGRKPGAHRATQRPQGTVVRRRAAVVSRVSGRGATSHRVRRSVESGVNRRGRVGIRRSTSVVRRRVPDRVRSVRLQPDLGSGAASRADEAGQRLREHHRPSRGTAAR